MAEEIKTGKKRKIRECIYCGKLKPISRDHVVPKCLFLKPYPTNLITVPACDDCNNEKSKDDDFLRDFLVMDNYSSANPIAQSIFHSKTLSSQRKGSSAIAREAIVKARIQPLYTAGGVYVSDFHTFSVDEQRLKQIFERLVKGLYFDSQKKRFPSGYTMDYRRHFPWEFKVVIRDLSKLKLRRKVFGQVFGCAFANATEDPFSSAWLFWFYERILFSVFMSNPSFI